MYSNRKNVSNIKSHVSSSAASSSSSKASALGLSFLLPFPSLFKASSSSSSKSGGLGAGGGGGGGSGTSLASHTDRLEKVSHHFQSTNNDNQKKILKAQAAKNHNGDNISSSYDTPQTTVSSNSSSGLSRNNSTSLNNNGGIPTSSRNNNNSKIMDYKPIPPSSSSSGNNNNGLSFLQNKVNPLDSNLSSNNTTSSNNRKPISLMEYSSQKEGLPPTHSHSHHRHHHHHSNSIAPIESIPNLSNTSSSSFTQSKNSNLVSLPVLKESSTTPPVATGKLVCDKCDGKHATDNCPYYKKQREDHPDAQKRSGKQMGGTSLLPGAYFMTARVVRQPGDGSCLFHSMSYGLGGGYSAGRLRAEICNFINANPNLMISETPLKDWVRWDSGSSVSDYCRRMSRGGWGGGIEMAAVSQMKQVNVHVYERSGVGFKRISAFDYPTNPESKPIVRVLYCGGVHYDALVA